MAMPVAVLLPVEIFLQVKAALYEVSCGRTAASEHV